MDAAQRLSVALANTLVPGGGVMIDSGFELFRICNDIGQVLSGMKECAAMIPALQESIEEDVDQFTSLLNFLKRITNQDQLTESLQQCIVKFEREVNEYDRVVAKFKTKILLKQILFHGELDDASAKANKTAKKMTDRLVLECAVDASSHTFRSPAQDAALKKERYMAFVDSPQVSKEMADDDNQKEILAILDHLDSDNGDPVVGVIQDKLRSRSSAIIQNEVNNLPDWHITEDQVKVDEANPIDSGGDAKLFAGVRYPCETRVVVKIYHDNVKRSEQTKQKFISTMNLWRRLSHQNICQLYGACYLTPTPFVVMELCDKGPLDRFLRQHESNRRTFALEILAQAAAGVVSMHSTGIVHGDLKCDNILVMEGATWQAKVCDFDRSFNWMALKKRCLAGGLASAADVEISGAVRWVAPECVEGKLPSPASDVYSFGMTLYQALMGNTPFGHISSEDEVRVCKLRGELPTRDEALINDEVWQLIQQACQLEPRSRPAMYKVMASLKSLSTKLGGGSSVSFRDAQCSTDPIEPTDLVKVCKHIGVTVIGLLKSACKLKMQRENIDFYVEETYFVLDILKQLAEKQAALSEDLQGSILNFESDVAEYHRIVTLLKKKSTLKQLVFHSSLDAERVKTKATITELLTKLTAEHGVNVQNRPRPPKDEAEHRKERYLAFVESPEVAKELADPGKQKGILAIIKFVGIPNGDPVVSAIQQRALSSSGSNSAAVEEEVRRTPPWHICEGVVDLDEAKSVEITKKAELFEGFLALTKRVAVMRYDFSDWDEEQARVAFETTMATWERLRHQHICRLYGGRFLPEASIVVSELCIWSSLDSFLVQHENDRRAFALHILAQAAEGIAWMHSESIVHGDLRCHNILVAGEMKPKAKVQGFEFAFDWSAVKHLHRTDGLAVDAGVMVPQDFRRLAPEICKGMVPSPASDVYSFGVTLYEALTGFVPFQEFKNRKAIELLKNESRLSRDDKGKISDEAWNLIQNVLHPDAQERPTMEQICDSLKKLSSKTVLPPLGLEGELADRVANPLDYIRAERNLAECSLPTLFGRSAPSAPGLLPRDAIRAAEAARPDPRSTSDFEMLCDGIRGIFEDILSFGAAVRSSSEHFKVDTDRIGKFMTELQDRIGSRQIVSDGLRDAFAALQLAMKDYYSVVTKFEGANTLKQQFFKSRMDEARSALHKSIEELQILISSEISPYSRVQEMRSPQ